MKTWVSTSGIAIPLHWLSSSRRISCESNKGVGKMSKPHDRYANLRELQFLLDLHSVYWDVLMLFRFAQV